MAPIYEAPGSLPVGVPASPVNGEMWYDESTNKIMGRENAVSVVMRQASSLGNVINVATTGGDYTSIKAAMDAITGNSAGNPFVIRVWAGIFPEAPMVCKSYVHVMGQEYATIVAATDNNNPLFSLSNNSSLSRLCVSGPTNSDAFRATSTYYNFLRAICVYAGATAFRATGAGGNILVEECKTFPSVSTGVLADTGGRIDCSNVLQYAATAFKADAGTIWVHNSGGVGNTNGLYAINAGKIKVHLVTFEDTTNAIRTGTGVNDIWGGGVSSRGTSTYDVLQEADGSSIILSDATLSQEKQSLADPDLVLLSYIDETSGVRAVVTTANFSVGTPEYGRETSLGEGGAQTRGMLVYTYDPSSGDYTNVSTAAKSRSGSTFTFPSTAQNAAIYVASDLKDQDGEYLKFYGLRNLQTVAAVLGSGSIVTEIWNGSAWAQAYSFTTGPHPDHLPYGDSGLFLRVAEDEIIRFCTRHAGTWTKNDPVTSGIQRFWLRFRVATAITTAPVFEQFAQFYSSTLVSREGYIEYHGAARPYVDLPFNISSATPAVNPPNSAAIYISDNLNVGRAYNLFANGVTDRIGAAEYCPSNMDTGAPVIIRWSYICTTNTGNINWIIRYGWSAPGDVIHTSTATSPSVGANEQSATLTVAAHGTVRAQSDQSVQIWFQNIIGRRDAGYGDILWFTIERDGAADTCSGDVIIEQLAVKYVTWAHGVHSI